MYSRGEGAGAAAALRSHHTHDHTNSFDDNLIVIYNRVPKTGSTSFINLAYDLCKRNHFYVLHINITANMHVLSLNNQVSRTKMLFWAIFGRLCPGVIGMGLGIIHYHDWHSTIFLHQISRIYRLVLHEILARGMTWSRHSTTAIWPIWTFQSEYF